MDFQKRDEDLALIEVQISDWEWDVDRDELENAALDGVFFKCEWLAGITVNG